MAALLFAASMNVGAAAAAPASNIVYVDASSIPTLHCRTPNNNVLGYCAIYLPPGEALGASAFMSDSKRWALDNTVIGDPADKDKTKPSTSVVLIKPTTNVPNITMIVYIPTTSARGMYRAIVVSGPDAPLVSELHFEHLPPPSPAPRRVVGSSVQATFSAAQRAGEHARELSIAQQEARAARAEADAARAQRRALAEEILRSPCKAHVDTAYRVSGGHTNFTPVSVYGDASHTCIVMPSSYDGLALPYEGDDLLGWAWVESDHLIRIDSRPGHITLRDGNQAVNIYHE